jgi:potassium/chloride transporter 9
MASSIPPTRSTFQTRTARDEAGELSRRSVVFSNDPPLSIPEQAVEEDLDDDAPNPYEPLDYNTTPPPRRHSFTRRLLGISKNSSSGEQESLLRNRSNGMKTKNRQAERTPSSAIPSHDSADRKAKGLGPRPVGGHDKLGTFSGVFVPTCLNVLSILMFLRFGFILGQAGVVGILGMFVWKSLEIRMLTVAGMLIVAYLIDLITTFSLSAIATNGTVRGGGAYYLISRSLGPEFGGAIGLVFYLGLVFNTGLNAVALIDCIKQNFGVLSGNWYQVLPESAGWDYLWATIILLICTGICLAGSAIFARASTGLLVILLVSTFSIPFSTLVVAPFESRRLGIQYTGLSWVTFKGNLMPRLTKGAAGSRLPGKETFEDLFGILFPATSGIFAGASMSGGMYLLC